MSKRQLERLFEIDRQIQAGCYPHPQQLAEKLEVSRRQIFVDRDMLQRLGATIRFDRKRGGWYYAHPWEMPAILIGQGELLAFFLSIEIARRYQQTPLEIPLRTAVDTLVKHMTGSVVVDLGTLGECYTYTLPPVVTIDEKRLLDLYYAIRQRQQVSVSYYTISRGELTERIIDPYHIHSFQENWYVVAFDHLRQAIRTFNVGRIKWHTILSTSFEPDPAFDAREWMRVTFQGEHGGDAHEVAIRFDAYQARYVREQDGKYAGQRIEELPDGGVILHMETSITGTLRRWVMQFGSHAEVLSPRWLREEIATELRRATDIYNDAT